jgi:cathepsin D
VNGNSIPISKESDALVVIDTGPPYIVGPSDIVSTFYAQIKGSEALSGDHEGYYSFPCSTRLEVSIVFGGSSWPINPKDMNLGPVNISSSMCLCALISFDVAQTKGQNITQPAWTIGENFLKNVYSVSGQPTLGWFCKFVC